MILTGNVMAAADAVIGPAGALLSERFHRLREGLSLRV